MSYDVIWKVCVEANSIEDAAKFALKCQDVQRTTVMILKIGDEGKEALVLCDAREPELKFITIDSI